MSSYFDALAKEVSEIDEPDEEIFLATLGRIENRMIAEVNLVTGDREFPDDLRERIQGLIAVHATHPISGIPNQEARERACFCRDSPLVEELHDAFHDVARARIHARFGYLGDSPSYILLLRKDHDEG